MMLQVQIALCPLKLRTFEECLSGNAASTYRVHATKEEGVTASQDVSSQSPYQDLMN
jgi:hypothetical protein